MENRRKFFVAFAKKMEFDPTKEENWAAVTKAQILAHKVIPLSLSLSLSRYILQCIFSLGSRAIECI